ncbi:2,3-diaminopropionate biosynthesis protein SbnB [Nannocystis sp. ILAH1]|uniref:2,3-diaminopropionate biosynthesis protein SbnB n=1 Tax=Nannocystis sp. ILAH1 TaxID=2996789 RepID=UPI00226F216B|nr:2,3-diaminopropionate biosynthesis protein SbnB [Nannocystis sp. ILAH1]MCY0989535.1 2,3-diaminopropionate biosynthesis protein SbnB [Nannocystis sp. ILAH1]
MMEFATISGKTCHRVIHDDIPRCLEIVREAYLAHRLGDTVNPPSAFLRFPDRPDARIISLPAHLGGPDAVSGIKWIASYPQNLERGIPRASAVLILNRADNGYPFACLEASVISAARTAASAALGAELLHGRKQARALGIVGTGYIARYVHTFLLALGWEVDELWLFDRSEAECRRFREAASRRHSRAVRLAPSVDALLAACDLCLFATTTATPHADDPAALEHCPTVLHLSLRDLGPRVMVAAQNIVDDARHALTAATSLELAARQAPALELVSGTLADVMSGAVAPDFARPRIFSPFGLGILDVALGRWIAERARETGDLNPVPDFFHEMTR